jgi:hypothetical protein
LENEKRSHKEKLEQLTSKEATINKEKITEPIKIEKLLVKTKNFRKMNQNRSS